uniref:Uncharacterized protein n=1 Tax=Arundo donax TaxID=35708 RepID=A0A0A9GG05_ARUDO
MERCCRRCTGRSGRPFAPRQRGWWPSRRAVPSCRAPANSQPPMPPCDTTAPAALSHSAPSSGPPLPSSSPSPTTSPSPIFADIVPRDQEQYLCAFARSSKSVLALVAPPVVGYLAEHAYSYNPLTCGVGV